MSPIAVTGMHRTGTSMVAKTLQVAGLHLGDDADLVEPAPDNPDGFFEHAGLVRLNDDLLEATGGAWDHPPSCGPIGADDLRAAAFFVRADELITKLAVAAPWGWKDPRTCLTARFWIDLVPDLRFVVCLRHPLEVALSLKRRNQVSYALGLSLWHDYYQALLDTVPEDRRMVTHYEAYFDDSTSELDRLLGFAGLAREDPARVNSARDPRLRHHRLAVTLSEAGASPAMIDLYRRLCDEAGRAPEAEGPRPNGAGQRSAAQVERVVLDLALAREHVDERGRQVETLRRERREMADRVAGLEAAAAHARSAQVHERLDGLEDAVHDLRYRLEDLHDRDDASIVPACRELVREHLPRDASLLVVAKDDPALLDLYGRHAANFPQDETGRYPGFPFAHSTAAIAHLEAQRLRGNGFFLIPETARWWLDHFSTFAEHLGSRYEIVADPPGAGLLVDVTTRRPVDEGWPRAVSATVDQIAMLSGRQPAILDWTDLDMGSHLPGRNVFAPPGEDERLPYLDGTVDVVLVEQEHRLDEARRVAASAVVKLVRNGGSGPVVDAVEVRPRAWSATGDTRTVVVVDAADPDESWLRQLREALADEPGTELVVSTDPVGAAAGAETVALVEEGVIPLPGCFTAARATLADPDRVGAVAVKLFAAAGALEAAGGTVFANGSCTGIAGGSHKIAAPWHDFVRETCWAPGVVFLTAAALEKIGDAAPPPAARHAVWAAELWAAGLRVVYQPEAAAVRALPAAPVGARARSAVRDAWGPALDARPDVPESFMAPAWRELLARDDVEASWR